MGSCIDRGQRRHIVRGAGHTAIQSKSRKRIKFGIEPSIWLRRYRQRLCCPARHGIPSRPGITPGNSDTEPLLSTSSTGSRNNPGPSDLGRRKWPGRLSLVSRSRCQLHRKRESRRGDRRAFTTDTITGAVTISTGRGAPLSWVLSLLVGCCGERTHSLDAPEAKFLSMNRNHF